MSCGNLEEGSPIVRCVACVGVLAGQVEKVGLRFLCTDKAMMVLFRDPKFLSVVVVGENFKMDLMHSSLSIVSGGLWWSPGGSGCRKRRVNWNGWIRIGSGRGPLNDHVASRSPHGSV